MARFFIDRPVFAIVISLVILLAGALSLFSLPVAQYPQITLPTVNVSASYPGASAAVVEQAVAQPLEQQVNGVEGMLYMSSISTADGAYSLNVTFGLESDPDIAAVQVQNRASVATAQLPSSVSELGVTTRKQSPDTLMYFALHSPGGTYDALFLKNFGSIYVVDAIKRVKGVGNVAEYGSDFGMRIWLDPERMARLGITTNDIQAAVREQNVQAPAGQMGQYPASDEQAFQYSAELRGQLATPEDFASIILRANAAGGQVLLGDVARVELAARDYRFIGSFNGRPAAIYAVNLTPDASAIETSNLIKHELERLAGGFPPDLEASVVQDNTVFVEESLNEVVHTFFEALVLVLLVVLLFLQSWRATLIPTLAVPVSLIGTFAAFVVLGFSVNTVTLLALVLAIGIVVDDAIVVVEAVEHHMRHSGLSARDATVKAMEEVSGPVIAIALVLCAVFVPVAFMSGITGVMYQQFGLTVACSVLLSALVALTLTPALCAMLLKPPAGGHGHGQGGFFGGFNRAFDWITVRYGRVVAACIRRATLIVLVLLVAVYATSGLMQRVPGAFVPQEDQGYFITAIMLPEAATLARTIEATAEVERAARAIPGVKDTLTIAGINIQLGTSQPNTALMVVTLEPWDERGTPELSLRSIIRGLVAASSGIAEARVMPFNPPAMPGLGAVGGFSFMLQDQSGGGPLELERVANDLIAAASERPELTQVNSTFRASTPSVRFHVDREKAKQLGVPLSEIFATLQTFLGGLPVNDFSRFGRSYKVTIQADAVFRRDESSLDAFEVRAASGAMVPMTTLVSAEHTGSASVLRRYNVYPAAEIGGSPAPGYSSGQAIAAMESVAAEVLPPGYGYEWSGVSRQEKESAGQAPIILALALVFMFLFLAAQYESWAVPFAVLFAIPLGVFGAFLALFSVGLTNNIYTQIGIILLIGLSAKNAILIVEFAKLRHEQGLSLAEAAREAAELRLRPIVMTSLAFLLGVLPLVRATGAGAGARTSIGISVFGGMLAATVLALLAVPVLYVLMQGLASYFVRRSGKAKLSVPGEPH